MFAYCVGTLPCANSSIAAFRCLSLCSARSFLSWISTTRKDESKDYVCVLRSWRVSRTVRSVPSTRGRLPGGLAWIRGRLRQLNVKCNAGLVRVQAQSGVPVRVPLEAHPGAKGNGRRQEGFHLKGE